MLDRSCFALCVVVIICSAPGASYGQGSARDYARADELRRAVTGKVLNAHPKTSWLSDHEVIVELDGAGGSKSFVLLDARSGERRPAFDAEALALALTEKLGRPIAPDRLPLASFQRDGTALEFTLAGSGRAFRLDDDAALSEIDISKISGLCLAATDGQRSRNAGGEGHIVFVNRLSTEVALVWLDRDGGERRYGTVAGGSRRRQQTFSGHLWRVEDADGSELGRYRAERGERVVIIEGAVSRKSHPAAGRHRQASPDGQWQAFLRDDDLWIRDRKSREEHRLSTDGSASDAYTPRLFWSPDSSRIAIVREQPAQQHDVHLIESSPQDRLEPRLHTLSYLKPGDRIAHPRVALFDVGERRAIPLDDALFPNPWSITQLAWNADGSEFRFLYNERGHQTLRVLGVGATDGHVRAIVDEHSDTFIDYSNKTYMKWLDGGRSLLWMSERSGWNHLYRIDAASGEATAITSGEWLVRAVDDVDDQGRIHFRALGSHPGQDPYHVHYGRILVDGTGLTWLTGGDGTHEIEYSPGGEYIIDRYSRVDLPPVTELRRASDGMSITELARADISALLETGWRAPVRFVAKGRDGQTDIWGVLFLPSQFDASAHYPVIEQIYAGPHGHFVPEGFRVWHNHRDMAELGFVVVQIDGMGTNWRSRAFHDVCWRNLGDAGFPDRIAWLEAAARERPYLDLTRVGIYGGSAGGQSALRALLAHGDFYEVAVADCGCHDNRMDKIWWNEAWMGWPIGPHYAEQSNVTQAHRLEGKLLLIVGELDRNVDPSSTMQVVHALIQADKDFDLLVMPGVGHGAAGTPYGRRRQRDFFVRHLLGREPRWE